MRHLKTGQLIFWGDDFSLFLFRIETVLRNEHLRNINSLVIDGVRSLTGHEEGVPLHDGELGIRSDLDFKTSFMNDEN